MKKDLEENHVLFVHNIINKRKEVYFMQIKLRGIAEGIVGKSVVSASSVNQVLQQYPALTQVKSKLHFTSKCISGFAACDG